jgi:hypothetical protein
MTACDRLLEVDLPTAVTDDALDDPRVARVRVNSVMALVECGYSSLALDAAGFEDNFQRISGVAGLYSEYRDTPGGGTCDTDAYSSEWIDSFLTARAQGYDTYAALDASSDADVPDRQRMMATVAFYEAVTLGVAGEYLCEFAVDAGPMLTASQTLDLAEAWADSALSRIAAAGGDFALDVEQGTIAASLEDAAYALRARIRYANGDLTGAASDAAQVGDGFMAWVLREDGEKRRNMVSSMQGGGGGTQAAGFLQGPITLKTGANDYGVSRLGSHPVTSAPWPDPVPFTGYVDLAIEELTGRAVDDDGYPITTATPGASADTRVRHVIGNTAGGPDNIIQKYRTLSDDIPLVNWREMRLIQAEAAGASSAGVDLVNEIRSTDGLPNIAGTYRTLVEGDADAFDDMLIEERRRALWLEARFWSTKIIKNEKLWFPRRQGEWVNASASYALNGGVRLLMPQDEYQINPNLDLGMRGTGCGAGERPVFN